MPTLKTLDQKPPGYMSVMHAERIHQLALEARDAFLRVAKESDLPYDPEDNGEALCPFRVIHLRADEAKHASLGFATGWYLLGGHTGAGVETWDLPEKATFVADAQRQLSHYLGQLTGAVVNRNKALGADFDDIGRQIQEAIDRGNKAVSDPTLVKP